MNSNDTSTINTVTDDIRMTIDDVLTVKNDLVNQVLGGDASRLPVLKELLIAIYIRGFFTGAHYQEADSMGNDQLRNELMLEVVKGRLRT